MEAVVSWEYIHRFGTDRIRALVDIDMEPSPVNRLGVKPRGFRVDSRSMPQQRQGGTYSPLTFNVPRFKRTSTGAPPSSAFCRRRRYCNPMFFAAL